MTMVAAIAALLGTAGTTVSGESSGDAPPPATASARETLAVAHLAGLVWMVGKIHGERRSGADIEKVLDANPHISGLYLGGKWGELEPTRGTQDWKSLDAAVEAARHKGRFYKLSFIPGTAAPDWVYSAGAAVFETLGSNPYRTDTYQKPLRIPVPWDPVFLREFTRFVAAAGRRYAGDPLCAAVTITGANFQSDEAHLPKSPKEIERWESLGYREKLPTAYQRYIDMFAEAFPRQQLCLHISSVVRNNDGVMEKAVAYGARRYPDRFTLQNCQLSGRNDNSALYSYALIQKYAGKLHVGYQSLAYLGEGQRGARQGDPRTSVANFVRGHGEYWELWDGNGRDPAICKWLLGEIERARSEGTK
jgi:hypothetical protein